MLATQHIRNAAEDIHAQAEDIHAQKDNLPPERMRNPNRFLRWYAVADIVAVLIAFLAALLLSTLINQIVFSRNVLDRVATEREVIRFTQPVIIAIGVLLWFQYTGHYRMRMTFWTECKRIVSALGVAMLIDGFMMFAEKQMSSRLWLTLMWIIAAFLVIALRSMLRAYLYRQGHFQIRTLLVGGGENARRINAALKSESGLGYEVIAQLAHLPSAFLQSGASWRNLCARHNADHVIIALDGADFENSGRQLAQLARENVPFSVSPSMRHLPVASMSPQYFLNHDALLLTCNNDLEYFLNCFFKRTLDIAVSGSALLVLSPIMLAVALLVRRDGGPALYGHKRLGRNGKVFSCLKFRSMVMNGDEVLEDYLAHHPEAAKEWKATRKLQKDPRVTPLGHFLRRSSLDELPQLLNVLRGDMSLVGPRPIVSAEITNYEGDIAHYYRVRPGITGLWQVSGRNDVSYTQRVNMDRWYVVNWALWHDIAILCKTIPALLSRNGAY